MDGTRIFAVLPAGFGELFDSILRNRHGYFQDLFSGGGLIAQVLLLLSVIFLLGGIYGAVMGTPGGARQSLSSAIKVPCLFLLTLMICLPALCVITMLLGSQLSVAQTTTMILFALAVGCVVLASCATIAAFFAASGSNYHFMKLLHVFVFAASAVWGMGVLWKGLYALCQQSSLYPASGLAIMVAWMALYGFVGAQMAWRLRPFIGDPGLPFELFRKKGSELNFYAAVLISLRQMKSKHETDADGAIGSQATMKGSGAAMLWIVIFFVFVVVFMKFQST